MQIKRSYSLKVDGAFKIKGLGDVFLLEPIKLEEGKVKFSYVFYDRHYRKHREDTVRFDLDKIREISNNIPKKYKETFDNKINDLKNNYLESLFNGVDTITVVTKNKEDVSVSDFLCVDGKYRLEEYNFDKSELSLNGIKETEENLNKVSDLLSIVKMYVTDYNSEQNDFDKVFLLENLNKVHPINAILNTVCLEEEKGVSITAY